MMALNKNNNSHEYQYKTKNLLAIFCFVSQTNQKKIALVNA